jgi:glycosyltransferase involved in cell wall biosynthesis
VVPLGVDLDIYSPHNRAASRAKIGLPPELSSAFIVGNVNRNQPRKRLDLSVMYFAEWIKTRGIDDAYMFLHIAPTGEMGYDVRQLAQYCGVANKVLFVEPDMGQGIAEEKLAETYGCFDVQLSTTQGEGFGLTTFEGMACGIPQVYPSWSALEELVGDAGIGVPCTTLACTPNRINVVGGVPDREATIEALNVLYESKHGQVWARCQQRGLALVKQDRYRWENIGLAFATELDKALYPQVIKSA